MSSILGISAYFHDSASALLIDGKISAASQEERFTRNKGDASFPEKAIQYCLDESGLNITDLDYIVFYDNPTLKFDRILSTYLNYSPRGFTSFLKLIPLWLKGKCKLEKLISKEIRAMTGDEISELPPILFINHHRSHAAAAFFPSPFQNAAILCIDGVGEWATTSVWLGDGNKITPQWELRFPHSLGLLYSAFTYYIGFKVNFGEYKLMGLAPYGEPKYKDIILENLIDLKDDGTFKLNMKYFDGFTGDQMINAKFESLFGKPKREAESELTQFEMDIARSIQEVTEEIVLRLARTIREELGVKYLCLGGGVALNCVANGRLLGEKIFDDIWIQPASGDAGSSLGAAYSIWYEHLGNRRVATSVDKMLGSYLGPSFDNEVIHSYLNMKNAVYTKLNEEDLLAQTASHLANDFVVGWFQGRMEFGPRALGNRSILGDPRNSETQTKMNLKIKFRESFRPFAPAVLAEKAKTYFNIDRASPYMLLVAPVTKDQHKEKSKLSNVEGLDKLKIARSTIPAVTHVDYSARVQTVEQDFNPRFYKLLKAFDKKTDCPILVNTSFNVRGEPIVCTPDDAYNCFLRTRMDYLVMGNFLLSRVDQPTVNIQQAEKMQFTKD